MSRQKTAGIYKITCTANGRIYIGQSTDTTERLKDHIRRLSNGKHDNPRMQNAWNKYGPAFFVSEVVEECQKDFDILNEREVYWIEKCNALDKKRGFNIASGGGNSYACAGKTDAEMNEIRRKMSEVRKEYYKTHDSCFKGRHWSEEERQRIRESVSGPNGIWYGKKRPEHSALMSGAGNSRAKKAVCVTTGEVFNCMKDGADKYGIAKNGVVRVCRNQQKTAGRLPDGTKLVWEYYEEGGEIIGQAV